MAEPKDEWVITRPGEEPPPAVAPSGMSASEWMVTPNKNAKLPSAPLTASDAINIGAQGGNSFLFGMGNRIIAASRALEGKEGYSAAVDRLAAEDKAVRERHPKSVMASELVGGIGNAAALTSRGILRGAPEGADWLAAGVRGFGEGGILGALQGAGTTYSGIPSDYVHNAGMGGILGAGVGAATPAVAGLVAAPFRAAADAGWLGGPTKALATAAQADAQGLRNLQNIPGAMMPDAGPSMLGAAQGARTGIGGEGKTALDTALRERDAGTSRRVLDQLETFGPAPTPSYVDAGVAERMAAMAEPYRRVLENARAVDPEPIALWLHGQIGRTAREGQAALREVLNDLSIPGNPGVLNPDPVRMQAVRSAIKREIRDPNTNADRRAALELVEPQLTRELQDKVPGLRELDHAYAELGAQQRAIGIGHNSAGKDIFSTGQNTVWRPNEFADAMREGVQPKGVNVGPSAETFRLREAARAEMDRIVGTTPNDLRKLETLLGEPQDFNSQKLAIAFGQERADALRAVMDRERNFRNTYHKIVQGPETADRLLAAKAQEAGKIPWDATFWGSTLRTGQEAIQKALDTRVANARDRIALMMAEKDPATIQQHVERLLGAQPRRDMREEMARRIMERAAAGAPALAPSVTNR